MCIYDMICDRELLYCFAWAIKVNLLCAFANVYRPPLKRPLLYFLGYLLKRLALDILPSAIVTGLTEKKKKDKFKKGVGFRQKSRIFLEKSILYLLEASPSLRFHGIRRYFGL